jgi:hypothetical protein
MVSSCEHGNKPLGPIQDGEFLDYLSDCCMTYLNNCNDA